MKKSVCCSSVTALAMGLVMPVSVNAQTDPAPKATPAEAGDQQAGAIPDIIVTAQKRRESINDVPLSITAATGDELRTQGVTDVQSLVKVVPGFNAIDSGYGTPVYFLRGVGFFDSSLAAKPTVSVYLDEVPIAFSIMTPGASFDLERVEVLKGPQGTLFGQNATGGAINYIAAKPTDRLSAGVEASYGRFNRTSLQGYISGPLSDTLTARLALGHEGGGPWQRSYTRDDSLGARDFTQGRLLLSWKPVLALRVNLSVNGNIDKSDTQAPQFVSAFKQTAGGYFSPQLMTYAPAPANDRAADWDRFVPLRRDNHFVQASLRIDYDLTNAVALTSISSYAYFDEKYGQDADGTNLKLTDILASGNIHSFTQELRLGGPLLGRGNWVLGANYEHSKAHELIRQFLSDQTSGHVFDALGLPSIDEVPQFGDTKYTSKAVFANATLPLGPMLSASSGVRYTDTRIDYTGCIFNAGNGTYGKGLETLFHLPAGTFQLNRCATLNAANRPAQFFGVLPENNMSWRGGLEWKPLADQLIYANVSRGYKSGSFANLPASTLTQYTPVKQEQVTAYEIGFKSSLAHRTLQVNGAAFLYDYTDKQLKGRTIVPIFGPLEALVNIPKSRIKGAELQVTWFPVSGLKLNGGATYLDTKVTKSFINYTAFGVSTDFNGRSFPYTPKWQINSDVEYKWHVSNGADALVGASYTFRSSTYGDFVPDARLAIKAYGLLDLRAGVEDRGGAWRVSLYARNVTDTYYWQTAARRGDAIIRYAGMPTTYGITAGFKFR